MNEWQAGIVVDGHSEFSNEWFKKIVGQRVMFREALLPFEEEHPCRVNCHKWFVLEDGCTFLCEHEILTD